MIPFYLIAIAILIAIAESVPYQHVQFIKHGNSRKSTATRNDNSRQPRSFSFSSFDHPFDLFTPPEELWADEIGPHTNSLNINYHNLEPYITPDFSNGLEYRDPLLLTGLAAKRAVGYLYRKELFFGQIPHVRALLRSQEQRRMNGLSGNRLGSLRTNSPFYRYKNIF